MTDPIPGESLASLVARTTRRNLLPSAHVLLRQVGVRHPNNPTAALLRDLDEQGLAEILRQPLAEIVARRHPTRSEAGFVDFFGVLVRADEIVSRRRRFAPSAIAASPHGRALWSLKTVPCCTETWEHLVDACRCGAVQRWQAVDRLERCDVCNAPLSDAPAEIVEEELRDGLAFVLGLIDPRADRRGRAREALPSALAGWDGGAVLELAMALLPLTSVRHRPHRGELPPPKRAKIWISALSEAADLVRQWPESIVPALERAVARRSLSRHNVRYTGIADYLPALDSDRLPAIVREAVTRALDPISAAPGSNPPGQIAMMQAVDLLGRGLPMLAGARRDGALRTRVCLRANRLFPALDRAEVEFIHDFSRNRISAEAAADRMDLPAYAMTLIDGTGRIRIERHPFVVAQHDDPQLNAAEFARFRTELRRSADPACEGGAVVPAGWLPLHRVVRAIGGGLKPWGDIFDRLMNPSGSDPRRFVITADRTSRIWLAPDLAAVISSLRPVTMPPQGLSATCSQRDALEILNLPGRHAHLLRAFAAPDEDWRMSWQTVLELARSRITLAELSARARMHSNTLECVLDRHGVSRSDAIGWDRSSALGWLAHF